MSAATLASYETLTLETIEDGIVVLALNRPERLNSMTVRMFAELGEAVRVIRDLTPRAVILTGTGERAFSAGFDLAELHVIGEMGTREFMHFEEACASTFAAVRAIVCPVIAALHGGVAGGGLSLALAADIRLAAPTARLSAAFVRVGLSVGELGTSWLLTRLIGPGRAAELAFTARMVDADEALRIRLINRIVPSDRLLAEAVELARQIASNSPAGVRVSKTALRFNLEISSYAAAMELENRGQALLTRTADMSEALTAFGERRAAHFTGN